MKWVFWAAAACLAYTYAGYPAWLWLRTLWRRRPVARAPHFPSLSIVMIVRNEEQFLEPKLQNLLALDYPAELTQIIVVSDGSTDRTEAILHEYGEHPRLMVLLNQLPRGKAASLNDAAQMAQGEVLFFTDARQKIEPSAVRLLMENFADPEVGCASGELMLGHPDSGEAAAGMGLYWRIEKQIRQWESESGSVVGATGALYSVRRDLLVPLPSETILDDVYIPMHVLRQGYRVIFDSRVRAWDPACQETAREFSRKVRTLSGNYQLLQLAPWLLTRDNSLRFEFVSHKLLRLLAPFALVALFASALLLQGPVYQAARFLQIGFYGLSLLALLPLGSGWLSRVADAAFTFVLLNAAAAVAFVNFVGGRKVAWEPVRPMPMASSSTQEVK